MEDLTLPAAGQARIEAVDGGFQWLNFHMTDPLLAFGEVEFNIDASADGSGTITFFDQFGNDFANNVTLSGTGQNFFGARGILLLGASGSGKSTLVLHSQIGRAHV